MISLAIAYGHPEFIFATIDALLRDTKKNVPFNQVKFLINLNNIRCAWIVIRYQKIFKIWL